MRADPTTHVEALDALRTERDQLARALESRVVIEQAKGVLAERYRISVDDAFLLLRQSARAARVRIHDLAADVVSARKTPAAILRRFARDTEWPTLVVRERTEALRERNEHRRQVGRFQGERFSESLRVRTQNRWDAVELGSRLADEDWYLVAADDAQWDVVVDLTHPSSGDPGELRRRVVAWADQRGGEEGGMGLVIEQPARARY